MTPLELAGRNIYIREGCYACHSQMIRTLRDEVERYGPLLARGRVAIRPPDALGLEAHRADLARIGGKYSDAWHVGASEQPA
jgi:cytochrome c oxidase cbb3-type subunit 2